MSPRCPAAAGRRGMMQSGFPWIGWNFSSPVKPLSSITWTRPAAQGLWRSDPPPLSPATAAAFTWRGVGTRKGGEVRRTTEKEESLYEAAWFFRSPLWDWLQSKWRNLHRRDSRDNRRGGVFRVVGATTRSFMHSRSVRSVLAHLCTSYDARRWLAYGWWA